MQWSSSSSSSICSCSVLRSLNRHILPRASAPWHQSAYRPPTAACTALHACLYCLQVKDHMNPVYVQCAQEVGGGQVGRRADGGGRQAAQAGSTGRTGSWAGRQRVAAVLLMASYA
jgi:hypothetical protein